MIDKYSDIRIILKCLIDGSGAKKIHLQKLCKHFEKQEGERLSEVAGRFGFENISTMIGNFPEFKVTGTGLQTHVELQIVKENPAKEMEKRSNLVLPEKRHNPVANITPCGPMLVKTIDKIVPRCASLSNYKVTSLNIRLLDVQNVHRFWFTELTEYKKLSDLMNGMKECYANSDHLKLTQKNLLKGLYVAALFSKLWHRGFVIKVWPQVNMARILFVDFGTVDDIPIDNIRFMIDSFLTLPATAHRGVLSHVQPIKETWGKDSTCFLKGYLSKTLEAKIFKKNESDSSYFMAIRLTRDKEKQLLTNILIEEGFCSQDLDFMDRSVINSYELEFSDYESGVHLPDPQFNKDDSWLPSAIGKASNNVDDWLPTASPKTSSSKKVHEPSNNNYSGIIKLVPTQVSSFMQAAASSQRNQQQLKNSQEIFPITPNTQKGSSSSESSSKRSLKPLLTPINAPKKTQIEDESLKNFNVGDFKAIYVHVVDKLDQFYFYVKDDMHGIRQFLQDFNQAYEDAALPNDNFATGADVVIHLDENFCRGRISEKLEVENTYKIFLLDFGIFVERPKEEIFKMREIWMKRPAAVYSGKLANAPENIHIKTCDQLVEAVRDRFIRVKVSRLANKSVELIFIDS